MKRKTIKKILLLASLIIMFIACSIVTITYAYYATRLKVITNDGNEEYAKVGMRIDMLFDRLDSTKVTNDTILNIPYTGDTERDITERTTPATGEVAYCTYDSTAEWGTANNPFIISNIKHLNNLSILQNIGYFVEDFTSKFSESDNNGFESMPYFLVCDTQGKPVEINGTGQILTPIGNDVYPFIGYVGGAFNTSTATSETETVVNKVKVGEDDLSSDVSTIYNVIIQSNTDTVDVGLFGNISYHGSPENAISDETSEHAGMFIGSISTITDLLLYDVQIKVNKPTWTETLAKLIENHNMSYKNEEVDKPMPHENHHIGILAGHNEFADIKYISVYYSSNNIKAIDLSHTGSYSGGEKANYYSSTAILGFFDNMNPIVDGGYVTIGDSSISSITIEGSTGTGGGVLSGEGRGYVTAGWIKDNYDDSGMICRYVYNGDEYFGLEVFKNGNQYTLEDGKTVVTINAGTASITEQYQSFFGTSQDRQTTWTDFIVKDGDKFYFRGDTTKEVSNVQETSLIIRYGYNKEADEDLCTEWVRKRLLFGTQNSGRYYFYDGVFTFALSTNKDLIEDTWEDEVPSLYVGGNNTSDWKVNTSSGNKGVYAYAKQITSNTELAAAQGKTLIVFKKTSGNSTTVQGGNNIFLMDLSTTPDNTRFYTTGTQLSVMNAVDIQNIVNGYKTGELEIKDEDFTYTHTFPEELNEDGTRKTAGNFIGEYLEQGLTDGSWIGINLGNSEQVNSLRTQYRIAAINDTSKIYYAFVSNGNCPNSSVICDSSGNPTGQYDIRMIGDNTIQWTGNYFYFYVNSGSRKLEIRYTGTDNTNYGATYDTDDAGAISKMLTYLENNDEYKNSPKYIYGERVYKINGVEGIFIQYTYNNSGYRQNANYLTNGTQVTINGSGENIVVRPSSPSNYEYSAKKLNFTNYFYRISTGDDTYEYKYYDVSTGRTINLNDAPQSQGMNITSVDPMTLDDYTEYYENFKYVNGDTTYEGPLLEQFTYFTLAYDDGKDSTTDNKLQLIKTTTEATGCGGVSQVNYSLWCGVDPKNINRIVKTNNNVVEGGGKFTTCKISFKEDGTCSIFYPDGQVGRYVNYNNSQFISGYSSDDLYIYVLEATQTVTYGRFSFEPTTVDGTSGAKLSADQYVLWPDYKDSNYTAAVGSTKTQDPTYYVTSLSNLCNLENSYYESENANGWLSRDTGQNITNVDLIKKFRMMEGMDFSVSLAIGNGNLNTGGVLTAPVGTNGTEANIPQGCVAFRMNKSNPQGLFIRVIVSVPCTKKWVGSTTNEYEGLDTTTTQEDDFELVFDNDYYLGMWQVEAAGDQAISTMSPTGATQKIELPRSFGFEPDNTKVDTMKSNTDYYINVKYNTSGGNPYNGTSFRSYLNGDRILVAYAFKVTEAGVYVLGTANNNNNISFPMEIVYFSADGTSSDGNDGVQNSKVGSIDFVYDNGTDILTVKDHSNDSGILDYTSFYYSSLTRLYFDNTDKESDNFVDINDVELSIVRDVVNNKPVLYLDTDRDDSSHIEFDRYMGNNSDTTAKKKKDDADYAYVPTTP